MSKINAVRFINLSYNNNAIRISDETFHLHGESTLLSLQNGGGKSVLVQMMMAPFVHKRYRDAKERPFESYFTTAKPTFVLVEWVLDHGAGYVMAGMMVRRRQEISAEVSEELEIIQFISEYKTSCPYDIQHLPVVEKHKKEMVLKSFTACKQLFEGYKKDPSVKFFSYDMNNSAQARQYYDKLMEYQIHYKEWETIMKKVNLKESGLSDLFADCRDEKGLAEKWLLDAVASKLNKEKDRMKEFQSILEKYVCQYKDNQSKIQRRDMIRQFSIEAEGVKETALGYEAIEKRLRLQQDQIGIFLWQLEAARGGAQSECERLLADSQQIEKAIEHLKYQQISKAVYEAMDAERYCRAEREMLGLEREEKEQEYEQTRHTLQLLDCARQQAELEEQKAECTQYEQQLAVLNQKERDFVNERASLGYTLRLHYESAGRDQEEQMRQLEERLLHIREQAASEEEKAEKLRAAILKLSTSVGRVQAKIQGYDSRESAYNERYEPGFVRNILGEYEPAALEIRLEEFEKEAEGLKKEYGKLQQAAEEGVWTQKELERNLEDAAQKKIRKENELEHVEEVCSQYEQELEQRRRLLRYFGLEEAVLFDREKILYEAQRKLTEIEWAKRRLEKEEDILEKEHDRLTQGRVLELPEPFEGLLEELGISYVYGMKWLKKNQYTQKENEKLVRSFPFLPYAILLSARDMERLRRLTEADARPFTSFPIPLMVREQLDGAADGKSSAVLDFEDVSFYMLFNKHLLNEKKLRQMVAEKEQEIAKKKEQIRIRREEYESYFEKKEQLRSQTVTKELQEQAVRKKEQTGAELETMIQAIAKQKEEARLLAAKLRELQQQIQENVKAQSRQERRLEDLKQLAQAYETYLKDKQQLEALQRELSVTGDKERLACDTAQKLRERVKKQEIEQEHLKRLTEETSEKAACYKQYEKTELVQGRIEDLETRYQAITSQISLRQQEIERLLQGAREKERRIERELARRQKKYGLSDGEWAQTIYDVKAEEYQEQLLTLREQQYELKKAQWNEADKNAALASQKLEQQRKTMLEKCGQAQPMPKEEIQPVDFETEMEKKDYKRRELEQAQQEQRRRIGWYEENLTALAEFAELMPKDEQQLWKLIARGLDDGTVMTKEEHWLWESVKKQRDTTLQLQATQDGAKQEQQMQTPQDGTNQGQKTQAAEKGTGYHVLDEKLKDATQHQCELQMAAALQAAMERLSGEELRRKKGMLVRDQNHYLGQRQKQKDRLTELLNQMVRREIFAEDFYRKPIEAMLTLTDDAGQVLRQLSTTLQSYESLMEKIQVDISVVEEEKERIAELLGEYVHEVHQNLGRIDQNSTIQIREKSVKMLKITLPDWEENQDLYQIKIRDFMDETTQKGVALLEQNENAQEYLGTRMTTKNLYDVVVGIENIQIRLYKIEAQREYPITWSQVARNSGGEGFLSAFIILSSLLYYMRKDESDLFAQRNEGKVLLMDNPFAQTNASHLLKPLMDMAKKTNTQLICLSGLGGESIYNRFDNIYVLNLIAANLRSGMQYLKAEHMRGKDTQAEAETMLVSQIEVLGQQELIF